MAAINSIFSEYCDLDDPIPPLGDASQFNEGSEVS